MKQDLELIRGLEEELFKPSVRASPEALDRLLADGFVEFGRSGGVYEKAAVIRSLVGDSSEQRDVPAARDFVLRSLADDVVLLTYLSFRVANGREERHTLRSSIWRFIDGRWQMVFHQGTPAGPQT
ncbi:DUF4440 domain-containing protein [Bosea sp. BIWAKO-01]|uniref:nuclear transport factor 2 family protein n=1 Tax=Bosea sp. BIWAKO-01 TaxID=506668 RepID=UPI000853A4BF|nr:DUF4440 domain-containing protein [Bosea sp. BIWAKO-01]GAU85814.1 hypothetical protein BIWAKO_05762 [Bosea sp. BIWAKO-01]